MKVLVHVAKRLPYTFYANVSADNGESFETELFVYTNENPKEGGGDYLESGSLFLVDEAFAEALMRELAEKNPGKEVSIHKLVSAGVCPAGDYVKKTVSEDGVLPG